MTAKKTCYIISPIGKPDSPERKWANFVREFIITPPVTDCGYEAPARADDPDKELIMTDIIEQLFNADLVVADLTGYNPNVFYELGIRHCAQKPAIHLIRNGQSPPFDLGGNKAISINEDHLNVLQAVSDIKERIKAIEKNPEQFYSQVQLYIQLKELDIFKKKQVGKDEILSQALTVLLQSVRLQSDMIKDLKDEFVKRFPPQPTYRAGTLLTAALQEFMQKEPEKKPSIFDFLDSDAETQSPESEQKQ